MPRRSLVLIVLPLLLSGPLQATGAEQLRDPTRPYAERPHVPAKVREFIVTAIFVSEERRVAIVNGQRVIVGNQVDGATVIEILLNELRLKYRGREITARLLPEKSRE